MEKKAKNNSKKTGDKIKSKILKSHKLYHGESFTMMVKESAVLVYKADSFSKIRLIHQGATRQELEHFKYTSDLDYESIAKMLNVTKATLFNKRTGERFDSSLSERLMALTDLYSYGYDVMGSREKFNRWMKTDNVALQGKPLDFADTIYGINEIKNILGRIEHGIFS